MIKKSYPLFLILLFLGTSVFGKRMYVGPKETYKSITSALAAAKNADSIFVLKGIYQEKNIILDKSITLIGINYPILDGQGLYEILSIKSPNVTVSGFEIIRCGISSTRDMAAIKVYDTHHVKITNNHIKKAFFGIYLQYSKNCQIQNNVITAKGITEQESGNGIHCWNSSYLQIINNKISGHRDGIYFEFVTHSKIAKNHSFKNMRYGLHFMFSNNDTYEGNRFTENGAGVAVMFSNHVNMFHNYFEKSWGDAAYGILLKEIAEGKIMYNHFSSNTMGVYMEGATNIQMKHNLFEKNGWALKVQASCQNINIEENNFLANTFDVSTNGTLFLSNFQHNYWDKYDGYDLDKNQLGDVPYRPISLFSVILEKNPTTLIMFRSFISVLLDKTEKNLPSLTPEQLKDEHPRMKPIKWI
jgi:nitrous oxidase accessory protein